MQTTVVLAAAGDSSGWFALGGTAVGILLGAALDGARSHYFRTRERHRSRAFAAGVARHAWQALMDVVAKLKAQQNWPVGWDRVGWTTSWMECRGPIADDLQKSDYATLDEAFRAIGQFETGLAAPGHAFIEDDPQFLQRMARHVQEALRILSGFKPPLSEGDRDLLAWLEQHVTEQARRPQEPASEDET